jgi:peptide/nickel transport system substrate-binding protein
VAPSGPGLDEAAATLRAAGTVPLRHVPGPVLEHLDFSLRPAEGLAPFQDVRVRQGLAHCLDRPALAPYPSDPAPDSYLPASHPLYAEGVAAYTFDPARGRALLAEAGWTDTDNDGRFDQALTVAGANEALLRALAEQWLANCGVGVSVRPLTTGELRGDWPLGVVFGRRFELAVFGWRVGAVPPCGLYTSGQIADEASPGGANAAGYASAAFDAACQRALSAPDAAATAHAEAQQLLRADVPMLPLYFRPRHGVALPGVEGYALDSSSESELWNIEVIEVK